MTSALAWVPCCRCGAACVSTPARWLQALCQACRPAPVVTVVPWHPTIARVLPGELGAILPGRLDRADAELVERTRAARERYRVLVPSRPEPPELIGRGPRAALDVLHGDGFVVAWATYSCAEDTERGELLRTIVVRVPNRGYGAWEEGAWSSGLAAHPTPHICRSLDEWLNHVRGLGWAPPPSPPCSRCGRLGVRVRGDGEPYKHTRADWRIPLRMECT